MNIKEIFMKKILIIDDDQDVRDLLRALLESNYTVIDASNQDEAIALAWQEKPDLILLDILLQNESGFEICSQLKMNEELKDTPIVFISSKNNVNTRVTGYQLGGINFISKPFEPSEVKSIINTTLKSVNNENALEILNYRDIALNIPSQEVKIRGERIHFTSSEFKIIHLLLKNEQSVLGREKILNHIAPDNHKVNDRMIDTYISSIRKKIKNSNFIIRSVYGEGYKIQEVSM